MRYYDVKFQEAFDVNWTDWCKGGPRKEGWTRSGMAVPCRKVDLGPYEFDELDVDEVLAKNRVEVQRWHVGFLQARLDLGHRFNWKDTAYYWEYLKPRYSDEKGHQKAQEFIDLLADVADIGVRNPVWVADMIGWRLKFRYFRFDGCHRVACAKVCSINTVPTCIFSTGSLP